MKDIGISVDVKVVSEDELTPIENAGTFDFATWAWTPFTDPDAQLSYLTCALGAEGARRRLVQRRVLLLKAYDKLYDEAARRAGRDEAHRRGQADAADLLRRRALRRAVPRQRAPGLQHDKFTGFTAVPDPGGPVMVANDFLNYIEREAGRRRRRQRCEHGRADRHRSRDRARHHHRPRDDDGPPAQRRPSRLTGVEPGP